ncbi:MAG: hypothetical protein A3G24_14225 [Betaproteobacteria bacterium RIFCSPLOWO2_12_FULL_62_13]|nr:MAG: hypothetical protein A3G24_14225 [Betaproteobacteria bacterium RIFCSPLOWO2_12_FULL_62_13]
MRIPRSVVWMFSVGLMVLGAGAVFGQNYPNKPIRIVTAAPGSNNDWGARLVAQELTPRVGQQVIVENRPSVINVETVANAPPDGYTLLFLGPTVWLLPFLRDDVSWDPLRDFSPITLAVTSPNAVVVHPSLPVKSVKELIALAKARPGELNYGAAALGSTPHLAAELFNALAGVNIVRVPYRGTGPAMIALIAGEVQVQFPGLGSVAAHIKSGKVRALAVTSSQPSALAPGLPTVAASGVPGYESTSILGIFAPAKTPATVIDLLNQEIVRVLHKADVKKRFFSSGAQAVGNSPEEFLATIKSEMARWGKVIKDAGIRGRGD